jgi:HSP20 family molecular chaperone IbpA
MYNRVTLSGEKAGVGDIKPEAFHRNERASGKFVQSIDLPVEIDGARIQAKPKQISVKVA